MGVWGFTDLYNPSTLIGYLATIILVVSGMILIDNYEASLSSIIETNSDDVIGSVKNFLNQGFNDIDVKINELSNRIDFQNWLFYFLSASSINSSKTAINAHEIIATQICWATQHRNGLYFVPKIPS